MAAANGQKEVVELLILKGADVNAVSRYGLTPLNLATIGQQKEIVEMLIKHGAHE
jgi:ankyrin repeat protein